MKLQELFQEDKPQPQQVDEWVPAVLVAGRIGMWAWPYLATAVRIGAPAVGKFLSKQFVKQGPKVLSTTGKVTKELGKSMVKNPVKWTAAYGAYTIFDSLTDAIDLIADAVGNLLDLETIKVLGKVAVKYSIPAAGIIAILYGGKKLYDYMQDNPDSDVIDDAEPVEEGVTLFVMIID